MKKGKYIDNKIILACLSHQPRELSMGNILTNDQTIYYQRNSMYNINKRGKDQGFELQTERLAGIRNRA